MRARSIVALFALVIMTMGGKTARADKVEELIHAATSDAPRARVQALRMLDRIANVRAIPAMRAGLKDSSVSVRTVAVDGISRFAENAEVFKDLESMRDDPDATVRTHVTRALEHAARIRQHPPRALAIELVSASAKVQVPADAVEHMKTAVTVGFKTIPGYTPLGNRPYGFQLDSDITAFDTDKSSATPQYACAVTYTVRRWPSRVAMPPITGKHAAVNAHEAIEGAVAKAQAELVRLITKR